jgi:hypothetical protein
MMMQTMTRGNESSAGLFIGGVRVESTLVEDRVYDGYGAAGAHAPDRRRRARVGEGGHRGRKEDVGAGGGCAGDQLLRSRSGGVLAARVSNGAGRHQLCGRFGEHRSRSAGPADEDGCGGSARVINAAGAVCGRRSALLRVVRVPSVADEDARQLHRTWETLQGDRTRVINRLKAVLATHGVRLAITVDFLEDVASTRVWDGSEIPSGARELGRAPVGLRVHGQRGSTFRRRGSRPGFTNEVSGRRCDSHRHG